VSDNVEMIRELTAEIVSAYVSNNHITREDLPKLIETVFGSLQTVGPNAVPAPLPELELVPAVPVRKSVTPDQIICLEDGKAFKSLKRHLASHYGLTPEAYRTKWGLPNDYPMVAANYAAKRSELARAIGLGRERGETQAKTSEDAGQE